MRVRSRRARPPMSSSGASEPNSSTRAAASAVEIICGRWLIQAQMRSCSEGSRRATRAPIFSAQCRNSPHWPACGGVLARKGREEPGRSFKKVGVGEFDARMLFAGHGVSSEEALTCSPAERLGGLLDDLRFGAAYVGDEIGRAHV